ncbi:uncharacterized protein EV420DRAFT_1317765 [Desarmillaria tabescens]|uniref:Heterokaryon incompatibility domain-containing protein n=1 Tax=Armillaria tabescens TaxID=1929756 RepID=A0AA39J6U3_ARMTA|nr:uncharacterized protein EV420DRAFT_1317765 [Desarmillaria tabescens]KAK0435343.1 hypothetical protein EV420DRAFT_1317765 [Desarmillaria tabescens]
MNRNEWFQRYYGDYIDLLEWEKVRTNIKYMSLPEVTLSAFTETGQTESSIPIPKQRSYTGRKPIMPSSLANTRCTDLGVEGVLEMLNTTLGTSYTLENLSLSSLIDAYITQDYDLGTAYAHLRPVWYGSIIEDELRTLKARDQGMRQDVLVKNRIIDCRVPPRRIWDLYSNRVVPWWVARQWPQPISHAWMEREDRVEVLTPINGYNWPVPIPKDTNLNLIRIEMLNLGAEYVWLDVLCLRQAGGQREDLRMEEWKLDVPTIGFLYQRASQVVCYFSGLGRPFSLKADDFESDRCWFRRAWTLQEISNNMITGGDTGNDGTMEEMIRVKFEKQLSLLQFVKSRFAANLFHMLSVMQERVSTNTLDKVAGLTYTLLSREVPAYYEMQSLEDAWTMLVNDMREWFRSDLLFLFPKPGNGNKGWRPSWRQVMTEVLPLYYTRGYFGIGRTEETDADWHWGPCFESGYVQGLARELQEGKRRQGELVIEDKTGAKHAFKIIADHQYPIPEGSYTLLGSPPLDGLTGWVREQYWLVGQRLPEQKLKKVSVFQIHGRKEVKRLHDLGIAAKVKTFLA